MSDLISRQAAINTVLNIRQKCDTNDIDEYRDILVECFEALPTAERKGKWMPNNVVNAVFPWCCSECNSNQADRTPYCQMCGARMEESDEL